MGEVAVEAHRIAVGRILLGRLEFRTPCGLLAEPCIWNARFVLAAVISVLGVDSAVAAKVLGTKAFHVPWFVGLLAGLARLVRWLVGLWAHRSARTCAAAVVGAEFLFRTKGFEGASWSAGARRTVAVGTISSWRTVSVGAVTAWRAITERAVSSGWTVAEWAVTAWRAVAEGAVSAWRAVAEGAVTAWRAITKWAVSAGWTISVGAVSAGRAVAEWEVSAWWTISRGTVFARSAVKTSVAGASGCASLSVTRPFRVRTFTSCGRPLRSGLGLGRTWCVAGPWFA